MNLLTEKLHDNILLRQKEDKPLIKYIVLVLLFFLLCGMIVTWQALYELETISIEAPLFLLYIFLFIVSWLRFQKVNAFIKRKQAWYNDITEFTKENSSDQKDCIALDILSKDNFAQIKSIPIKLYLIYCAIYLTMNGFSNFLSVNYILEYLTMSLIFLIIRLILIDMPMNSIWNRLQNFESQFDQQLTIIWKKEQWIENDIDFITDPRKDRNFILWSIFSFLTGGIMWIIWDYKIHTDPNNLYPQFHSIEDNIFLHIEQITNNNPLHNVRGYY